MRVVEVHLPPVRARSLLRIVLGSLSAFMLSRAHAQEVSSAVYVRTDTDHTTVVTPRVRVGGDVGSATRVDATYSADIWTSASIDIATSASKAVTEQRDEIDLSVTHELLDATLGASYRFSTEPDYRSHGVTLSTSFDLAQKSTTLALSASALFDQVGRVGDPRFSSSLHTLLARVSGTQLLDAASWLQAVYEIGYAGGYLASPYRWVGIGPGIPRCADPGAVCVREVLPAERVRHALALTVRRALSDRSSIGASYRFYIDGWDLLANTAQATFSFTPGLETRLGFDYRFYSQSAARYYRASVSSLAELGTFTTRDKELSPFISHALTFTIDQGFALGTTGAMHLAASLGPTWYLFDDFPAYDHLFAFEATLAARIEL